MNSTILYFLSSNLGFILKIYFLEGVKWTGWFEGNRRLLCTSKTWQKKKSIFIYFPKRKHEKKQKRKEEKKNLMNVTLVYIPQSQSSFFKRCSNRNKQEKKK